jgi:hypothetical protein
MFNRNNAGVEGFDNGVVSGLELTVDENNLLHQMWKKAVLDESFYQNYEKWLEEEVWSYYD